MTPLDLNAAGAAVLSWLLTYAIHSTILLTVAALAAWRFADRHAWLDLIWKTALIAPLVTATLPLTPSSLLPRTQFAVPSVTTMSAPSERPVERSSERPVERSSERPVERSSERSSERSVLPWPSAVAIVWLVIALIALVRYGVRLRGVYHALRSGSPVTDAELIGTIDGLRSRTHQRRPIPLTTSPICPVPLALAGRHIVLPDRFLEELDPDQQRAALAHEMAHVARRDPEWRIAVEILERALFFQPLNRLARARLCDSAEFLCDEWAVQQTQSPLALARCLSVIASWWSPAAELPAGVSAMARSDSAMVRRVTRILEEPARVARRPRLFWLAVDICAFCAFCGIPVTLVAVAAPRVTATHLPAMAVTPTVAAGLNAATAADAAEEKDAEQRTPERVWTAAEIDAARAQRRVYRPARPADALEERWRQALADAARQRFTDFWVVYTFNTPIHADDVMLSDSSDGSFVSSNGQYSSQGPPLTDLTNRPAVPLEGGNVAVLLHYRGNAIDRAGYRSLQLGFDFGRTPVFFVGDASESQSFERVRSLFDQTRTRDIQVLLIELASLHANANVVLPFLTRLVDPSWPADIRNEAAEGFGHHHDPRSVEILLRVARTDPDSEVRAEAAETIGEVQVPQSIAALNDLVSESADPGVRREAAEAFGDQPAERALPAIERVIATSQYDDVLGEAIEALGDIGGPGVLQLLVQTANSHSRRSAQVEAVETIGDLDAPGVIDALTRLVWDQPNVAVQREAVETLGDRDDDGVLALLEKIAREHDREEVQTEAIETIADRSEEPLPPVILELAVAGNSARIRKEALDKIGEAVSETSDVPLLDRAQRAIERAIFDDPDMSVRVDALDAVDELPGERALRVLRDVIARHPDARVRREAEEHLRERRQ